MSVRNFLIDTRWHDYCNRRQYDAPAEPWEPIRVDPSSIEHYAIVNLTWGLGRVRGGKWDLAENLHRLDETSTYRGLKQRYEEGCDWEETAYYRLVEEKFGDGETVRGYGTIEKFREDRCESVDDLFERIERDGYRPNGNAGRDTSNWGEFVHGLEPLVVIGRSGEVIWTEGYHRLIIASILDIDEIPVYVLRRHEEWQRIRDGIHGTPLSEPDPGARLDHPDVQDVAP